MRVAMFIDGKNFHAGWKDTAKGRDVDFRKLAQWVVRSAGGTHLVGAHYYTGLDTVFPQPPAQEKLQNFLLMLEEQTGYFVHRFQQRNRTVTCTSCQQPHTFSIEKEVDTTMVADMLRLAAVNAFDGAVLVSGDADFLPAVEGVRALGKIVYVASWAFSGMSAKLRAAAYDHINLHLGLPEFKLEQGFGGSEATGVPTFAPVVSLPTNGHQSTAATPVATWTEFSRDVADLEPAMLAEIKRAQDKFPGGYVGVHFFVTQWRSESLPENLDLRRTTLDQLVEHGKAAVYLTDDGTKAVRLTSTGTDAGHAPTSLPRSAPRSTAPAAPLNADPTAYEAAMLSEIKRAQTAMPGGYVGAHFFVTKWRSTILPEIVDFRRRMLDRLQEQGKAEVYLTDDGVQAVRVNP